MASLVKKFVKPPLTNLMKTIPLEVQERVFTNQQLGLIADHVLEWPHKARGLGLSESEIEDIREDNKFSTRLQKCAMLTKWAEKYGDRANLKELVSIAKQNHWDTKFIQNMCRELGYIGKQRGMDANFFGNTLVHREGP